MYLDTSISRIMKVLIFVLVFPLPELLACYQKTYSRVIRYDNMDVNDSPLYSDTTTNDIFSCARLCFERASCLYMRLSSRGCRLYSVTPTISTSLQGTQYFTDFSDHCKQDGYIYVMTPRLCFKSSQVAKGITKSWSDSEAACEGDGGRLIVLDNEEAFDYVQGYLTSYYPSLYNTWVGMTKVGGVPTWTGGSTYARQWYPDEPDDISYQNCIAITATGLADLECPDSYHYVCEIEMN